VRRIVEKAIEGVGTGSRAQDLRVLDPAMGAGAFLCEALRVLVVRAGLQDCAGSRREIAKRCIHGIDSDPEAVRVARRALWLTVADPTLPETAFDQQLVHADALFDSAGGSWRGSFPDVFERDPPGFDLIVANPPFLGGKRIRTVHGDAYADRLALAHPGANKNTDLSAHFLRRAFDGLRRDGALGFVTTNTITQGDTREGGLACVLRSGGTLYAAESGVSWPGVAGVVTTILWLKKGPFEGPRSLNGRPVASLDAFLSPFARSADPARLPVMRRHAFIGCFLRGSGFLFGDGKRETPVETMHAILARHPQSRAIVRPYMGGEEVMTDPEHRPRRFVIHFDERSLDEAKLHTELYAIVENKVRPFRESKRSTKADEAHRAMWWRFANPRPELARATAGLRRVIGIPRVAAHLVAVFLPVGTVHSDQLVIVASESPAVLALLSSRVHEVWAKLLCSTFGAGLRYTPSDAFETFPIPHPSFEELERDPELGRLGGEYHELRARLLLERGVGLSRLLRMKPREDAGLTALHALRDGIDRAVLRAYGWVDLAAGDNEVLGRLFALNEARAGG